MKKTIRELPQVVVRGFLTPFERFAAIEASSGLLLVIVATLAMIWANSPWYPLYKSIVELPISVSIGDFALNKSLQHWVNDALMVVFFFVVGLEIKRELLVGELSTFKKAALPAIAALGGMVVPAAIYKFFNLGGVGAPGWGIPMATDIAFAVGVLSLMSRKVPFALKVFLLALAIIDDLGAVIVIAVFYTANIVTDNLALAVLGLLTAMFLNLSGVRKIGIYWLVGIFVWYFVFKSGVHATVAGVILGMITPIEPIFRLKELPGRMQNLLAQISAAVQGSDREVAKLSHEAHHHLDELNRLSQESRSPLDRLIHGLHPYVSYVIMPIFAFVNAGVHLSGELNLWGLVSHPIGAGVILGLFIGKPVGIFVFSYLGVKLGLAALPRGVTWSQIGCVGFVAGIGFTMALFISSLALKVPELEVYSKIGILIGSFFSAVVGLILLALSPDAQSSSRTGAH